MNIRQLTALEIRKHGHVLESAVGSHGVRRHPGSDLDRMIRACQWLGSAADDAPQPDTAYKEDANRAVRVFPLFEQARRLSIAITTLGNAGGISGKLQFLRNRFDRLVTQDSQAQDALFEIEVAARIARSGALTVTFAEPDIVASASASVQIAVACKRPRSQAGIKAAIRSGAHQIERQERLGIIVVGVEPLFHRTQRGVAHFQTASEDEFVTITQQKLQQILVDAAPDVIRAFATDRIAGVLFCGVVTSWSKEPSAYLWRWVHGQLPNLGSSFPELMRAVETLMFDDFPLAA